MDEPFSRLSGRRKKNGLWNDMQREDLQSALEKARDKNRRKSGFIAGLSHEIRTPLNSIVGVVNFLQGTKLDLEQKKFVDILAASSSELLVLVEELLDLSLLEAGALLIRPAPFALRSCCGQAVCPLALAVRQRSLDLEMTIDPSIPDLLVGDSTRLRQVLQNLVKSAVAFTPKGKISLKVSSEDKKGDKVPLKFLISMEEGISEKQIREALEHSPLDRTSSSDRFDRAGMGFLIAREIIGAMRGDLSIGTGNCGETVIYFTLILKKTSSPPSPEEASSPFEEPACKQKDRELSILVIDDNRFNGTLTKTVLRKKGGPEWTVALAESGPEALSMMEKHFYDVVFLDVRMPGMDGLEIAGEMRKREEKDGKRSLIIAMTACAMDGDRQMCLDAGMDDYLAKPASFADMKNKILRHGRNP